MTQPAQKPGSGLEPNVASMLCYVLCAVTGIIFLLIEKENKNVRFHAWQSTAFGIAWVVLWIALNILAFIPVVGLGITLLVMPLIGLAGLILYIVLIIKAYQGERFMLPFVGEFAAKQVDQGK